MQIKYGTQHVSETHALYLCGIKASAALGLQTRSRKQNVVLLTN